MIKDTLNHYYDKSLKLSYTRGDYNRDYFEKRAKIEETIDHNCVKEKLNLAENGFSVLLKVEADILIVSAKSKCIKIDTINFAETFLNFTVEAHNKKEKMVNCAKYKLYEFESTSVLDEKSKNDQDYEINCSHFYPELRPYQTLT